MKKRKQKRVLYLEHTKGKPLPQIIVVTLDEREIITYCSTVGSVRYRVSFFRVRTDWYKERKKKKKEKRKKKKKERTLEATIWVVSSGPFSMQLLAQHKYRLTLHHSMKINKYSDHTKLLNLAVCESIVMSLITICSQTFWRRGVCFLV